MKNWEKYLALAEERPWLFDGEELKIILDEKTVAEFERTSGREIGVAYESPRHYVLVDLLRHRNGKLFAYERVVPVKQGGVAVLPVYEGKVVLIREFRHPLRCWCWEIPRGFGEEGASASHNALKELREETGITKVATIQWIGQLTPNSGLTSDCVDLFLAKVKELNCSTLGQEDTETISAVRLFSLTELRCMVIAGELTDVFTLSAIALWLGNQQLWPK